MKAVADIRTADYAAYIKAGVCPCCKQAAIIHPRRACPSCNATALERNRARQEAFKAAGLCWRCGGESGGRATCAPCRAKRRRYRRGVARTRATEKTCTRCGGEVEHHREGSTRCQSCAEVVRRLRRDYAAAKAARGECQRCSASAAPGKRLCAGCAAKESARGRGR